ncbi:MAG: nuclear transport factor 2 family protein [Pseudolabrys sp.]|nr:nuclear transport factor 2 family protein [Pseudolabrys sp.]
MTIESNFRAHDGVPSGESAARAVVLALQEAFRRADYARMAALYDDDIDWLFHGPVSIFPEIGLRRGKAAVFRSFERLNTLYHFERYVTDHVVAENDWAASIADVTMTQRATSRVIQCRIASFHRVHDGRLVEYRGFCDTFDAVEQTLGRELAV